jgi:Tol biopolymer transport system component
VKIPHAPTFVLGLLGCLAGCTAPGAERGPAPTPPLAGAELADHLIADGETHFAHLWKLTSGFDNAAEGYWSFAGDRIVFQAELEGVRCDRIFVTEAANGVWRQLSNGKGKTTCAYFLPNDDKVIYASTHLRHDECPPPLDYSKGYVWAIHPEFDLFVQDLATGDETRLTRTWGYDAEATISPVGDRIVFTSTRSGDLELWACDLEGNGLTQLTARLGYDGGGFFSSDGEWVIYRRTRFGSDDEHQPYRDLLREWTVRPHAMDIWIVKADGSRQDRAVTDLGGASFAPYFFPGDERILFATNHHDTNSPQVEFDLFAVDIDGEDLEQVTTYVGFDSFPMFSPDGGWLVFASNRGGSKPGETNLFLAQWK